MPKELFLSYRLLERGKHVMLMPQNIIYNEELSPHFSQEILDKICEVYQALTMLNSAERDILLIYRAVYFIAAEFYIIGLCRAYLYCERNQMSACRGFEPPSKSH